MFILFLSLLLWLYVCDIFSFLLLHNKYHKFSGLKQYLLISQVCQSEV